MDSQDFFEDESMFGRDDAATLFVLGDDSRHYRSVETRLRLVVW